MAELVRTSRNKRKRRDTVEGETGAPPPEGAEAPPAKLAKQRRYCFTAYVNVQEGLALHEFIAAVKPKTENLQYLIYQMEICPSTFRPHIQGYVEFKIAQRLTAVFPIFSENEGVKKPHVLAARGDAAENIKYCSKHCLKNGEKGCLEEDCKEDREHGGRVEDSKAFQFGTPKVCKPGFRSDIAALREAIVEHVQMEKILDIPEHQHTLARVIPWAKAQSELQVKKATRDWRQVETYVHIGPTGTDKTKRAEHIGGMSRYTWQFTEKWFDSYAGEEVLIIDDVSSTNTLTTHDWLRLLQGNQQKINVKCGHTFANWKQVHITSNEPLEKWFPVGNDACMGRLKGAYLYRKGGCEYKEFTSFNRGANPALQPVTVKTTGAATDILGVDACADYDAIWGAPYRPLSLWLDWVRPQLPTWSDELLSQKHAELFPDTPMTSSEPQANQVSAIFGAPKKNRRLMEPK